MPPNGNASTVFDFRSRWTPSGEIFTGGMQPAAIEAFDPARVDDERADAMHIRTQVTFDGVWTVFVDEDLCISDLDAQDAEALVAALRRLP